MFKNNLFLVLCVTIVLVIVEVQARSCSKPISETYLVTATMSYSYVTPQWRGGDYNYRSYIKIKTISKIARRTRRVVVPCNESGATRWDDEDYSHFNRRRHQRIKCRSKCHNGVCDASGTCVCNAGYAEQNKTCVPVCENCYYGTCVAPDHCVCSLNGHIALASVCPLINSSRICGPGYTESFNGTCEPYCSSGCQHGFCVAPELCFCLDGYREDDSGKVKYTCTPKCTVPCGQGTCVAPDFCECFEGYKANFDARSGTQCLPVCENCNGTCVAPNKCEETDERPYDFSKNTSASEIYTKTVAETTSYRDFSKQATEPATSYRDFSKRTLEPATSYRAFSKETTKPSDSYFNASMYPIFERNVTKEPAVEPFVDNYNKSKSIHKEFLRKSENQEDGVSILISIIIGKNNCGKYKISVSDDQDKN